MKVFKSLILAVILLGFMSCSKENNKEEQKEEVYQWSREDVNADFDNSSAGIYIGMAKDNLVAFSLDLKNDEKNVGGKIFYYGEEFELTPEDALLNMVPGDVVEGSFSFEHGELNISINAEGNVLDVLLNDLKQPEIGEVQSEYPNEVICLKKKSTDVINIYSGAYLQYIEESFMDGEEIVNRTLNFKYDILLISNEKGNYIDYNFLTKEDGVYYLLFEHTEGEFVDGEYTADFMWGSKPLKKENNSLKSNFEEIDGVKDSEYYFYLRGDINTDLLY